MSQTGVTAPRRTPTTSVTRYTAAVLLAVSAILLFGFDLPIPGYTALVLSPLLALLVDRSLGKDVVLIAAGLGIISAVPLDADLSIGHMLLMGGALALAAAIPYLVSRFVYREHVIRFPIRTGRRWGRSEWTYIVVVVALGFAILPSYLINTGEYLNWPPVDLWHEQVRLFIGVNAVGIWDELFFICTTFTLLRRHFPDWLANILQATLFASFLWEIGYRSWGPLLTAPFALLQGFVFRRTKSLLYVVTIHLLFDLVLFLVLLHAHHRDWLAIFVY